MWKLSSLSEIADRAKEAAARIERQLEESTGNQDSSGSNVGGLSGGVGKAAAATSASSLAVAGGAGGDDPSSLDVSHDDFDDDDDFFSDTGHQHVASASAHPPPVVPPEATPAAAGEAVDQPAAVSASVSAAATGDGSSRRKQHRSRQQQHEGGEARPSAATKLDVTADEEGDDFFGDGDGDDADAATTPSPAVTAEREAVERPKEEGVDFGGENDDEGAMGGDGWDGEEIALDDEDDIVFDDEPPPPPPRAEQAEVEDAPTTEGRSVPEQPPVPSAEQDGGAGEGGVFKDVELPNSDAPVVEGGSSEGGTAISGETQRDVGPTPEGQGPDDVAQAESPEVNSEGASSFEDVNNGETIQEDYIPVDVGSEDHPNQSDVGTVPPTADGTPESQPTTIAAPSMDDSERQEYLATIAQLESQLRQREEQLASKSDQIASLSLQRESETAQLRQVVAETKEEAKKRIVRAKERVEEMQAKLTDAVRRADAAGGSSAEQSDIIAALREEGEKLARKQAAMEQSVRSAKGEARELREALDAEREAREGEEGKVASLRDEVRGLKEDLASARRGETLSKKLEGELVAAKEESEKQRANNLGLEQQLKELKDENKSLRKEVDEARTGAKQELEEESNKLKRDRDDMLGDLENKLRTSEREANVREDALRHEVSELRKRWQDAVRRAEDLSMDVQQSTAPLLRQLESTERQNRTRAAGWAELETKLRSDIEEHVIQLEKLTKEKNNLVASDKRSQRLLKEKEEEAASSQEAIETLSSTIEDLETKLEQMEDEGQKVKQELAIAERKASESATKVRTEMLQTVMDSEQRYEHKIEALGDELEAERKKRDDLEKQLDDLAASVAAAEFAQESTNATGSPSPEKEKKLRSATGQASILHDTLAGIDSDVEDDDDEVEQNGVDQLNDGGSSFAAMEQLSLGLKSAKVELEALRKQLVSSEETRESLLQELGEARQAVEKLPLFEQKVSDLTMEVKLKDMELQGLQDDIADVRFLYRQQLDVLLEEKAASPSSPLSPLSSPSTPEIRRERAS